MEFNKAEVSNKNKIKKGCFNLSTLKNINITLVKKKYAKNKTNQQ